MSLHKEISLEDEICADLSVAGWLFEEGSASRYDRARALFPEDLQERRTALISAVVTGKIGVHGKVDTTAVLELA